jgi:hypothetical protein
MSLGDSDIKAHKRVFYDPSTLLGDYLYVKEECSDPMFSFDDLIHKTSIEENCEAVFNQLNSIDLGGERLGENGPFVSINRGDIEKEGVKTYEDFKANALEEKLHETKKENISNFANESGKENANNLINKNHKIKYGKIKGGKIKYVEKELKRLISLENYKSFESFITLMVVNMEINGVDMVEVESDVDVFIIRKDEDIYIFISDQICGEECEITKHLSKLKRNIRNELKRIDESRDSKKSFCGVL